MDIKRKFDKGFVFGALAVMLAALLWSLDGVFFRPKFYNLPSGLVVFLEHFLGFIILCPFIFTKWKKIGQLKQRDWLAIFWVCIFGGAIGTVMITKAFFAAIDGSITFATVVILQKLQPVFALIMARIILGEKLSKRFYYWSILAIISAYFLAFGKSGLNFSEINLFHHAAFFAFLAAFSFGSSTVFGKRAVNHLDYKSVTALRFGITALIMFVYILTIGDIKMLSQVTALNWTYLALVVFSSGAAAMFIYYFGLKKISASAATICELFWPFSAVILDYFINKNVLNSIQIVASLLLLLAFYMITKQGKAREISFLSKVVAGQGRGEKMGFPTINLDKISLDIDYGVYLVNAEFAGKQHKALLHFGPKDTFSEPASLELYLEEKVPLIPEYVKINIVRRFRDIIKFSSPDELKEQIKKDTIFLNS